jgi:predicted transcriptional regulator YdeE
MPKVAVSRSQVIDAPIGNVFEVVRDFHQWPKWSPWLIADPGCQLEVKNDWYSWEGDVCGAGRMEVVGEEENESITYVLQFFKPFKSLADVKMTFARSKEQAEVTWTMDSSLPFFLFWMTKSMEGFIGMDYERGLLMLKDLVEKGEVPSRLSFRGQERCEGFVGVGKKREAGIDEIGETMGADMEEVRKHFPGGEGFCVYHKWDIVKRLVGYTIAVKVGKLPGVLPDAMELVTVPEMDIYVVKHTGPYRHLGNGWASGMMHGRSKQFKHSKKFPPFEIYDNESDGEDAIVKICFPMK